MASLGTDLATIRKSRGLTLDDLQEITKLSPGVLKSIENNSIFEDWDVNTTYKRNYVRNYAKALQVDEPAIVEALNQVEGGKYEGKIGERAKNSTEESEEIEKKAEEKEQADDEEMIDDHSPEYSMEEPAPKANMAYETSPRQTSSFDWVGLSHKTIESENSSLPTRWIVMAGAIVIIAIAIFLFFYLGENSKNSTSNTSSEANIQQPTSPPDTLRETLLASLNSGTVSNAPPLPDTLSIAIAAVNGNLNPIYVFTDLTEKRPFWIEIDEKIQFSFVDSFRVQAVNQYDQMTIIFNDHIIENAYDRFYNSESKMIELSRTVIQNHPEWIISRDAAGSP